MDRNYFSDLYSASRKDLYKYCRRLCGNDKDAQDLMQQTYLRAWENLDKFYDDNFSFWLCSVAKNIFLDNLRKSKHEFIEELPEIPDSEENSPVYIAENRDRSKILMNKINNCLNPLQRLAVILYYYDEKSVSEIADIMQCSENTVKSRLFNARKKLRKALKNDIFSFGWLAVLSMKRRLKNIKISVNARITASAVLTVTAMTAVSMTNINTENKLPQEIIILESTSTQATESTETASIKPTSHTTTKPVYYTMPTEESLTTAFKSEFEEIMKEDDTEPEETLTEDYQPQTETEEETTMKKEIITVAAAATMALTGTAMTTTATTTAVDEVTTAYELPTETTATENITADESKTYLYFLKMSDEEFSEYTQDRYKEYGFGDDSIPDEIKFKNLLCIVPDFFIGDNYESEDYSIYRIFADGEATAYIPFYADSETELDRTLSADFFGYPKDWTIQYIDGIGTFGDNIHEKLHEYRICIPNEVILDFESYVRLYESRFEVYSNEKYRKYGITGNSWIDCQFLPVGEYMSPEPVYGDANGDDNVSISDSVAIMQSITNEEKYPLDDNAKVNADVYNPGDGVTGMDARSIMRLDAGIIDSLPEYPEIEEIPVTTTFPEEEYCGTTTTTAVFNPDSPKRTQGPDFEAGNFSIDRDTTKWYDKGRSEYMAEFQHAEFEKYFNKFFKGQENLISDTALYERILANLPVNFFPYMKTELLKIAYHENSLYGPTYITEEKLPDLLRISAIKNDARWIDQLLLDECAEIVHNEFSDYVTGTYQYAFHPGVEEYEGIMKYDSLFPFPDYCYRYYFIGDDNEENTRIAEKIITRLREAMTEKYGDCAIVDGDIWLDCYGVGTYSEWGLDDVYYPPKNGYYEGYLIEAFTSIKNIYFSPEGENITYWDISDQENEIIS